LCVHSVYKGTASSNALTLAGRVVQGSIGIGDRVILLPAQVQATVKCESRWG
jgi:sulfate adenylyltransferase subunit 1 (EFTu-like GTPase family)